MQCNPGNETDRSLVFMTEKVMQVESREVHCRGMYREGAVVVLRAAGRVQGC